MNYDKECNEASQRLFERIHGHLDVIRKVYGLSGDIEDENDALLNTLLLGDALKVENALYDIDYPDDEDF